MQKKLNKLIETKTERISYAKSIERITFEQLKKISINNDCYVY